MLNRGLEQVDFLTALGVCNAGRCVGRRRSCKTSQPWRMEALTLGWQAVAIAVVGCHSRCSPRRRGAAGSARHTSRSLSTLPVVNDTSLNGGVAAPPSADALYTSGSKWRVCLRGYQATASRLLYELRKQGAHSGVAAAPRTSHAHRLARRLTRSCLCRGQSRHYSTGGAPRPRSSVANSCAYGHCAERLSTHLRFTCPDSGALAASGSARAATGALPRALRCTCED